MSSFLQTAIISVIIKGRCSGSWELYQEDVDLITGKVKRKAICALLIKGDYLNMKIRKVTDNII